MTGSSTPLVPAMLSWQENIFDPTAIKISLAPLDDLAFPYDKRGLTLAVPLGEKERRVFAREVGRAIERTVLSVVNLQESDE